MSRKKHKVAGYFGVFREKLNKLQKKIKEAHDAGEINKEHTKRLMKEADTLKKLLKEAETNK